jgi:hypothetical protein
MTDAPSGPPTLDGATIFATIQFWAAMVGRPTPEVEAGSSLAGDARKSPNLQVAHAAWSGFAHAVDHLDALRMLIVEARVVHNYAPMTLVRAAMENAATAVWLLEPSQRAERLRRRLKLANHEAWEAGQAHKLLPAALLEGKRSAQERMAEIRALAIRLGLNPDDVAGRLSHEKLVRAAGEATEHGADRSAFVWRLCSGFAHGRYWASLSTLQHEVLAEHGNVLNVRLTNDVDQVLTVAQFPVVFTDRALRLYEKRRCSP